MYINLDSMKPILVLSWQFDQSWCKLQLIENHTLKCSQYFNTYTLQTYIAQFAALNYIKNKHSDLLYSRKIRVFLF